MNCDLCTVDILRGTMYRTKPQRDFANGFIVCDECRDLVRYAVNVEIDEPLCACGKIPAWMCKAAIRKPCDPQGEARGGGGGK